MPDSNDMPTSASGSGRETDAAATAHTDEDPARMPHRDPSPAPPAPRPTHTESPLPAPHAVLHEGDDHHPLQQHKDPGRTPDHQPADQPDQPDQHPQDDPYPQHDQDQDQRPDEDEYQQHDQYQYQQDDQYSQHSHHDDQRSHSGIVAADSDDTHDEDEFELTDGYETASTGSTSVTSSIYAHTFENGRRYQHFKNGRYPIPNDDEELNREDMKHAMLMELCDGQLFYAPIGKHPHKILDVGTGTGVWAIEVGDQFPNARVRGLDLSPTQPVWVPPNVDFLVDDCEQGDWLDQDNDLVHFRFMTIVLKDVQAVLRHAYASLKPGGWVELQELSGDALCDDGTMPDNDPVKYCYDLAYAAFTKFNMNTRLPKALEPLLRTAGFENVQCVVKKVPIGPWARDKTLRVVGMYQKMAVQDILPAFAGRPFTALGMSQVESQVTLAHARQALGDARVHRYFMYYFWFAQKPLR